MEVDSVARMVLAGEYREAARQVEDALAAERDAGSSVAAGLLADALGIVHICLHSRTEVGWHRDCVERSEEHERQVRDQLLRLLDVIKHARSDIDPGPDADVPDVQTSAPDEGQAAPEPQSQPSTTPLPEWLAGAWPAAKAAVARSEHQPAPCSCAATLDVYCLGQFRAFIDDQLVTDWPNCRSKSVFKYLVTHRDRPISREVLMETFWPNAEPDAARNNLNVAIYGVRKLLARTHGGCSYVLFRDACYLLNPELDVWVDADAFVRHCRNATSLANRGERAAAIAEDRAAEAIYQGELLAEDRYEDWVAEKRQSLQQLYCGVLNRLSEHHLLQEDFEGVVRICRAMLMVDDCDEAAHRRLMRCYCRLGQTHLAVRQYHLCVEALARRMHLAPSIETVELHRTIRQRVLG